MPPPPLTRLRRRPASSSQEHARASLAELTDADLLARMALGEKDSFEALYTRYHGGLFAFVAAMTGREEAKTVVQSVFVEVW